MKSPLLTIITVCKNSEKFLSDCIKSTNKYNNIEHIIIDGRSSDNTVSLALSHFSYRDNLRVISEVNPTGIYGAINIGLRAAFGKFIIILNSDDELVNLDKLIDTLTVTKRKIIVGKQRSWLSENFSIIIGYESDLNLPFQKMPWAHGSMVVSKSIYEKVGYYNVDYKLSSDLDWTIRLMNTSTDIEFIDVILSEFQFGGVSTTKVIGPFESYKIFRKYGGKRIIGINILIKAIFIKILAKFLGWNTYFALKKRFRVGKGIWG